MLEIFDICIYIYIYIYVWEWPSGACREPCRAGISDTESEAEAKRTACSESRVSTEVTFGRGDLSVCPLGVSIETLECLVSN